MKVVDYKKENKGITLIALIITIIVLLILAGVTISFVMRGGILDNSQLAVEKYKNSASDEDNTLKDMDKYLDDKVDEIKGVDMNEVKKDFEKDPEKYKHPDQEDTNGDRAVGTDGKPVNMDLWVEWQKNEDGAHLNSPKSGSDAYALYANSKIGDDGKIQGTVPQYIYSEEDGKVYPVVSMDQTFLSCINLKIPPKIPSTVTSMYSTFSNCTQLKEAPVIPNGVTNMTSTFENCRALQVAPTIPNGVTNMSGTFQGCEVLQEAPVIPNGVTNMSDTFNGCSLITNAPIIPDSVIDMSSAFSGCKALKEAPIIPDSVTDMSWTFSDCSALTKVTKLSSAVKTMIYTFSDCIALVEMPTIPDSVTNMQGAFSGCSALTEAQTIPNTVTNMSWTFYNCSALTGDLIINADYVEEVKSCLENAATNPGCELKLSGSCPQLNGILRTATSSNVSLKQ